MVSIRDIARETGFSITTVGAVLRGQSDRFGIKQETEEKILAKARSLGYCKNDLAAQMKSGQSRTILMLLYENSHYYIPAVLHACNAATQNNYVIRLAFLNGTENFEEYVQSLFQQRPAALLFVGEPGIREKTLQDFTKRYAIPYVAVDYDNSAASLRVLSEESAGIRAAVHHLLDLGHTRIVHATDSLTAQYAVKRLFFYREFMRESGLVLDESLCFHDLFLKDSENLKKYAERIAAMDPEIRPTAITCGSDYMAVKLLFFFSRIGIRVPEDISLIGYGGISTLLYTVEPKLTTIDQQLAHHGEILVEKTLLLLKKFPTQNLCQIPTVLLKGETTGPVKNRI